MAKVTVSDVTRDIKLALSGETLKPIAKAATDACRAGGIDLKNNVRSHIASAGFSTRWQNTWRVDVYPKTGYSAGAAIFGHHNIAYSNIFETGGVITGRKGLLWLPLPTVPVTGGRKMRPRELALFGVKLISMTGTHTAKPLLGAEVRMSRKRKMGSRISLAALRNGIKGDKGKVHSVPLFVGIKSVTIRARFRVSEVAQRVRDELPALYYSYVKDK